MKNKKDNSKAVRSVNENQTTTPCVVDLGASQKPDGTDLDAFPEPTGVMHLENPPIPNNIINPEINPIPIQNKLSEEQHKK